MKIDRDSVFAKCHGKCAYCGTEIKRNKFQVDHIIPQRNFQWHLKNQHDIPEFLTHLTLEDVNHPDNLLPACASCNKYKDCKSLEYFRSSLQRQPEIMRAAKPTVRLAERFGILKFSDDPIVFYFEKLGRNIEVLGQQFREFKDGKYTYRFMNLPEGW